MMNWTDWIYDDDFFNDSDQNWTSLIDFNHVPGGLISGLSGEGVESVARQSMRLHFNIHCSTSSEIVNQSRIEPDSGQSTQHIKENFSINRFAPPISDDKLKEMRDDIKPVNTYRRNQRALKVLNDWTSNRRCLTDEPLIPSEEFVRWKTETLNYWLCKFINECRRKDGSRYLGNSLVSILAGLQQILRSNDRIIDFFKDNEFHHLRECLDLSMIKSTQEHVGRTVRRSDIITSEEEILWREKQLGCEDPQQLIQTLFYLNGLNFAIRGGTEHSELLIGQFRLEIRDGHKALIYTEGVTKTYQCGF